MKRVALFLSLTVMALLSACSSPPVRYHTLLTPAATLSFMTNATHAAPFFIDVLPVGVPAQLDTSQLVIRQGDSSAVVLDNERWLSPLSEEIRTALSADLTQRLNTQDVSGLVRSADTPVVRIQLQVRRFDSWPGQSVTFDADWSLSAVGKEDERARLICRSQFTEQSAGGDTAMLHAQQQVITRLAEQIAATATRWMPDRQGTCFTPPLRP
ncbi:PqiC family protein [Pectobacterium polaris]|uniref:Membrane integrity-associated transporter subunit PqiC n=1 Tax=Pectobacterium polaris TaxID=2042057 RepID=A0AAW5G960_9GAMM|nr:PqiC family protein [Pectobacterium polaris]MCL6349957.1 membrane integrity-associated transporter subunit PqiC [Pectobacterium polaris]MCL6367355.1 membrane integrity-associated transporter subunit PqiC [Pectobacterium polaris]